MPNPKTIEALLKMKPCPWYHKQVIGFEDIEAMEKAGKLDWLLKEKALHLLTVPKLRGTGWLMPDGYYHLPPDKQLGLPLGEWEVEDLYPLVNVLPFDVLKQYLARTGIAVNYYGGSLEANDLTNYKRIINILKQPPNLYNPLDHKEVVLMPNNSANEKQPAKETVTEPERVSVQEFLNKPEGKWITYNSTTYSQFYQSHGNVETRLEHMEDLVHIGKTDYPIYATNPTAWLASQVEQEGNQ